MKIKGLFSLWLLFMACFMLASGQQNASNAATDIDAAIELNHQGVALYNQGKYDEAIQAYDKAIRLDPQNAGAWYNKGIVLYEQGKYNEAINASDKAIECIKLNPILYAGRPLAAEVWTNKGVALKRQGKYDEAIQALDKAIELNPNSASDWHKKGMALQALNRTSEADAVFAKANELGYKG